MRSFDVFDTVLTRRVAKPGDVFTLLGLELQAAGLIRGSPADFARVRQAAQDQAASTAPAGEATLAEIYALLAESLGWDAVQRDDGLRREIALEGRLIVAVPARREEIAALHANGENVVFLSDTQLPSSVIQGWLEQEGIWRADDRLLVSCEARASKRTGELFKIALRDHGPPSSWLHTGDNELADVVAPRKLGLQSREAPEGRLNPRERRLRGSSAADWRSTAAGAARLARLEAPRLSLREAALCDSAASIAGPFFFAFTTWVLDEATRRGVQRLYFVARGGQIFLHIAQALRQAGRHAIECRYLHLSRRALAGLGELDAGRMGEVVTAPTEDVHTLARIYLNLDLPRDWPLPPGFGPADLHRNLTAAERSRTADWLFSPERREPVATILRQRTAAARAYLTREGIAPGAPIAFVDTGWAGTLQLNLERFLGADRGSVPLTWFYLGLRECGATPAGTASGYANTFHPLPLAGEPWLGALLELFARADHGTLARFHPDLEFEPADPVELREITLVQQAILGFTRHYLAGSGSGFPAPPLDGQARAVIAHFVRFADRPSRSEALAWGRTPHSVHPADAKLSTLCPDFSPREVLARLLHRAERPPAWWLPGQAALGSAALIQPWLVLRRLRGDRGVAKRAAAH